MNNTIYNKTIILSLKNKRIEHTLEAKIIFSHFIVEYNCSHAIE
jgi:hypothetical protein